MASKFLRLTMIFRRLGAPTIRFFYVRKHAHVHLFWELFVGWALWPKSFLPLYNILLINKSHFLWMVLSIAFIKDLVRTSMYSNIKSTGRWLYMKKKNPYRNNNERQDFKRLQEQYGIMLFMKSITYCIIFKNKLLCLYNHNKLYLH